MVHRTIAIPVEDTARPQVLDHVPHLRNNGLRRADDNTHLVELVLVGPQDVVGVLLVRGGVERLPSAARENRRGQTLDERQELRTRRHPEQVLDEKPNIPLVALAGWVSRSLNVLAPSGFGQLVGLIDVPFEDVTRVLSACVADRFVRHLPVVLRRLLRRF